MSSCPALEYSDLAKLVRPEQSGSISPTEDEYAVVPPSIHGRWALSVVAAVSLGSLGSGCTPEAPSSPETPQSQAEFAQLTAEWNDRYVACARRFGAAAEILPNGSINQPYAPGRETRMGLDAGCLDEVGEPPPAPPVTEQFLRGWYVLLVEQAQCLRAAGFTVSDPPGMQEYVENYSGDSWYPLVDILKTHGDISAAEAACPQPDPVEAERRGA